MNTTLLYPEKQLGQYFTPKVITEFMVNLATPNKAATVLEPSAGAGVFIETLLAKGFSNIKAFEIDNRLAKPTLHSYIQFKSFITHEFTEQFDLIIGNPPYIRWKNLPDLLKQELTDDYYWNKYFNSLCDYLYIFILKSVELLKNKGELIFITPDYWLNATHAEKLRNYLLQNGAFEVIYHFNETPIFNAAVSTIVFKYVKEKSTFSPNIKVCKYMNRKMPGEELLSGDLNFAIRFERKPFEIGERWLLADYHTCKKLNNFEHQCAKKQQASPMLFAMNEVQAYTTIGDVCEIGNGMVSGLDKVFQLNGTPLNTEEKKHIISVIKAKDIERYFVKATTQYILLPEGLSEFEVLAQFPNLYAHFIKYKTDLVKRYKYNSTLEIWEWAFLRNYKLFSMDSEKIFVPCKERISHKNYFRFALAPAHVYPTQDVTALYLKKDTKEHLYYLLAFLNNYRVFEWLKYNGIIKGNIVEFSEKPLSSIPFRAINWKCDKEVEIHNCIVELVKSYIKVKNDNLLINIDKLFDSLF